jgi:hypothetical protein
MLNHVHGMHYFVARRFVTQIKRFQAIDYTQSVVRKPERMDIPHPSNCGIVIRLTAYSKLIDAAALLIIANIEPSV